MEGLRISHLRFGSSSIVCKVWPLQRWGLHCQEQADVAQDLLHKQHIALRQHFAPI